MQNKINLLFLIVFIFFLNIAKTFAQTNTKFDREKWIIDASDSSTTTTYRGSFDMGQLSKMIIGKNKKYIVKKLGCPDYISNDEDEVYYIYYVRKSRKLNSIEATEEHKIRVMCSIQIIMKNNRAYEVLKVTGCHY